MITQLQLAEILARMERNRKREAPAPEPAIEPDFTVSKSTDEARLNKTERAYLALLRSFPYEWIGIQNITLKLADDLRFTPDFSFIHKGRFTLVDVKGGYVREDAFIKIKTAARLFPWATFLIVKRVEGGWDHQEIKP